MLRPGRWVLDGVPVFSFLDFDEVELRTSRYDSILAGGDMHQVGGLGWQPIDYAVIFWGEGVHALRLRAATEEENTHTRNWGQTCPKRDADCN